MYSGWEMAVGAIYILEQSQKEIKCHTRPQCPEFFSVTFLYRAFASDGLFYPPPISTILFRNAIQPPHFPFRAPQIQCSCNKRFFLLVQTLNPVAFLYRAIFFFE